jgi:hypothetical protein
MYLAPNTAAVLSSDRPEEFCFPFDTLVLGNMATAIIRLYTADGFVVAADGREQHRDSKIVVSEQEQKIFRLCHPLGDIACTITGVGRIGESYRWASKLPQIASELEQCQANTIGEYAEHLAVTVKKSIGATFPSLRRIISINMLLDGYFRSIPEMAKAIVHCGPDAPPSSIVSQHLIEGRPYGFGSRIILDLLQDPNLKHEALRPYWEVCQRLPSTIEEAVKVARTMIEAQCDPKIAILAPEICATIGGHIHIAKVTRTNGFEWILPPIGQ